MAISTAQTYGIDIEDAEYLRHGGKPLLARLYKPKGGRAFLIMAELHGGAATGLVQPFPPGSAQ